MLRRLMFIAAILVSASFGGSVEGNAQLLSGRTPTQYLNFQKIGVFYNKHDNKYWIAAAVMNPQFMPDSYEYADKISLKLVFKNGSEYWIDGKNMGIHPFSQLKNQFAAGQKLVRMNIVIDNSSSIDDNNLALVESTLTKFIKELPVVLDMQIIKFSSDIVTSGFSTEKDRIIEWIKAPMPRMQTRLYDAMMKSIEELRYSSDVPLKFSVVFTDGHDTNSQAYKDRGKFLTDLMTVTRAERIPLFIVGVTDDVDTALLSQAASYGMYQHVDRFHNLPEAFDRIRALIDRMVLFRIPAVGTPVDLKMIYVTEKKVGGSVETIQDIPVDFSEIKATH